jgi:hypothetical protein
VNTAASNARSAPSAGSMAPVFSSLIALMLACFAVSRSNLRAETVSVRQQEGLVHGFLILRTLAGRTLAHGDLIQIAEPNRVSLHLLFHFKDGSTHDESTKFSQNGGFRVLSYHLVQKGPSFPHPLDLTVDCSTGQVTVNFNDRDGKEKTDSEHLDLPPDIANGIVPTLLKNILPGSPSTTLSFVAAAPKPRIVKLVITPQGYDSFSFASSARKATHFVVKVEIGGIAGLVAPLVGKQPADTHVWILGGEAPAFVKSEGPLFAGGPIWRIELASPVWPKSSGAVSKGHGDADKTTSAGTKPKP